MASHKRMVSLTRGWCLSQEDGASQEDGVSNKRMASFTRGWPLSQEDGLSHKRMASLTRGWRSHKSSNSKIGCTNPQIKTN